MISPPSLRLKRAVFGINHENYNPTAMNIAADLAGSLQLDLFGIFIMDQMLDAAMSYSKAREFSSALKNWRTLDPNLLRHEQRVIANKLKRELENKAQEKHLSASFEITSGIFEEVLKELSLQSDILIFSEPKDPLGQLTKSFDIIFNIAMEIHSTALIIPKLSSSRNEEIVVICTQEGDPSLEIASEISNASGKKLIVVNWDKKGKSTEEMLLRQIQKSDHNVDLKKTSLIISSWGILDGEKNKQIAEICRSSHIPLLMVETIKDLSEKNRRRSTRTRY